MLLFVKRRFELVFIQRCHTGCAAYLRLLGISCSPSDLFFLNLSNTMQYEQLIIVFQGASSRNGGLYTGNAFLN